MPKFKPKTINEKKLTVLWLRFLTEIDRQTQTVDQELLAVPEIKQALALTEESAYTPKELEAYERNWDAIRSEKTLMEDKWEEGLEKGREEGLAEGKAEGLAEGEAKGKVEEKRGIARTMLSLGLAVDIIAEATKLTEEEIEQLKK